MLILKKQGREEFKKKIGACLNFIPKDLEHMAYFPYLSDDKGVKEYLKEGHMPAHKRFKVLSFHRQATLKKKEKAIIIELLSYGLSDDRFKDPFESIKYKEKLEKISLSFWRDLFSLNLALASKNKPWLTQLIRRLGQVSPHYFRVNGVSFYNEELKMVRDYMLELMEKLIDREADEQRVKILARKISLLGKTSEFKEIGDEVDADWSLSELRSFFLNPLWKNEYFDFWYYLIEGRTSQAEIDSKLRNILTYDLVKDASFAQLWVLESYLPPDEKVREVLYSRIKDRWGRGTLLDTYEVLEILKMTPVKAAVSKEVKDLNRASFQLAREFYIRLINSGHSSQYALYQLYRLGDKQSDHLWWLVL